uniref:Uncharacterized protein n=1 Tax=Vitis vinifera TaxID=29760 RepID=F6H668_VITVI
MNLSIQQVEVVCAGTLMG